MPAKHRLVAIAAVALSTFLASSPVAGQQTTTTPCSTAPASADVPGELLARIRQLLEPPADAPSDDVEMTRLLRERMQQVLALGAEAEAQYPDAPNLHEARLGMLAAAKLLAARKQDPGAAERADEIARRILDSPAPPKAKLEADRVVTGRAITRAARGASDDQPARLIGGFLARYRNTDAQVNSTAYAAIFAVQANQDALAERLVRELQTRYISDPGARVVLRRLGRHPDVGRPFAAELPLLTGRTLKLPDDLLGKVVVIDFWATWCGPCIAELPNMKRLYARYGPKGVEFVGVSLDEYGKRQELARFVRDRQLGWLHSYTDDARGNRTAREYGITAIPSIWVVGADGIVVSDNGRGRLGELIEQALKTKDDR